MAHGACKKLDGQSCSLPTGCISGNCVDGFCCDSVCDGECMGCSDALTGNGQNGACDGIATNTDPEDECGFGLCDGAGVCGPQGWHWSRPKPQGNQLQEGWFFDANTFLAVGYAGMVVATDDFGVSTTFPDSGVSGKDLVINDVSFAGAKGWAVTNGGHVLYSADSGQTWVTQAACRKRPPLTSTTHIRQLPVGDRSL